MTRLFLMRRKCRGELSLRIFATLTLVLVAHSVYAASAPMKVTIHIPSKSLSIMPYYFGKDKGFFAAEQIEPQLVMMAPPTAIAALVAGELDFSSTTGAATSAIMRGLPLRRVFYVQQDPVHVLLAQPEIKSVQDLVGKAIGVTALTDAVGMSANVILRANGIEAGKVTLLGLQVTDNLIQSLVTKRVAATLLAPPYVEELQAKGYVKLAEARTYAPSELHWLGQRDGYREENTAKGLRHDRRAASHHELHPQSSKSKRSGSVRFHVSQARYGVGRESFCGADARLQQRRHKAARGGGERDRDLPRIAEGR